MIHPILKCEIFLHHITPNSGKTRGKEKTRGGRYHPPRVWKGKRGELLAIFLLIALVLVLLLVTLILVLLLILVTLVLRAILVIVTTLHKDTPFRLF
ncbi:hypothetical protein [Oscillibacter sp.]|uniref:hypothetical protein n=1 Tax=Oscillibacter sp. TaxID=1945593 RepID=UPI00263A113A|nr:hypothetical protein [Oscillibacter sp.]